MEKIVRVGEMRIPLSNSNSKLQLLILSKQQAMILREAGASNVPRQMKTSPTKCRRMDRLSGTGMSTARRRPLVTTWLISASCGRAGRSSLPIGRSLSARMMRCFRHFGISSMDASVQLREMPRTKSALLAFQCLPFQAKADCGGLTATMVPADHSPTQWRFHHSFQRGGNRVSPRQPRRLG